MWVFSIIMYVTFIIMGVMTGLTPLFGRKSTPFGVAVAGKHEYVEERKKKFAIWNTLFGLILGLPVFFFPTMEDTAQAEMTTSIYVIVGIIVFLIVSAFLYLKFRKEVMKWKETLPPVEQQKAKKLVIDMNYHEKMNTKSHFTFFIWQFIIILIPIIIAFAFYDRIPNEIPMQWDSQFEVSRSMTKSVWGILALPVIQILMIPVFNYSNHAIVKSKQKLSPLDPKAASEKSRRFREAWSNATFAITIGTQLLISFLFLYSLFGQGRMSWMLIAVIVIYLVISVGLPLYLTIKYGQAGEKLLDEEEQYYEDPEEEEQWKLGVFYFNKEDPSVFVEKRFGIGTTVNYGNWKAWLFILGILLFTVLTIIWSMTLT